MCLGVLLVRNEFFVVVDLKFLFLQVIDCVFCRSCAGGCYRSINEVSMGFIMDDSKTTIDQFRLFTIRLFLNARSDYSSGIHTSSDFVFFLSFEQLNSQNLPLISNHFND